MTTKAMSTDTRVLAKQSQTAMQRLDNLEATAQNIIDGANRSLQALANRVEGLENRGRAQNELIRAAVDILGRDTIDARVLVNRDADAVAQAEREKQELELLKTQGIAKAAETVAVNGLVAGVEKKPDGTAKVPGYTQAFLDNLPQELKDLLVGKKVGDVVTLPGDAGTFELQQIYDIVPPVAPTAAPAAPAAEAAPQAQAEA